MKVQKGEIDDPATLPVLFMAEAEDDWKDEALWFAVNPGLRHGYPDLAAFRDKARKAEHSPFERDSFLQFNLNRWLDQSTSPFVEMHVYDRGAGEVDLDELEMVQEPGLDRGGPVEERGPHRRRGVLARRRGGLPGAALVLLPGGQPAGPG
jgi:phage terminase large subunit-like protein